LTGVLSEYVGVCKEINSAHSRTQKDNHITFKDISAHTQTLLDQQTILFKDQENY
jgi:multidrug efflux pump subunit AcrA (membrane-fusion protein)